MDVLVANRFNRDCTRRRARRRRRRRHGRLRGRLLPARRRLTCRCPPRCSRRWTLRSAARPGVNHPGGKNLIGAFHQPSAVLADTDTLRTLPDRELRAGLAEVIKYGLIHDAAFFAWLEANIEQAAGARCRALAHAIRRSCEIKARDRRARRARAGRSRAAEPRPHVRPCHRIRHRLHAVAAWRGRRRRHADGRDLSREMRASAARRCGSAAAHCSSARACRPRVRDVTSASSCSSTCASTRR